jgi:bleomycin hydrolase
MRYSLLLLFVIFSPLCHAQQLTIEELGLKPPVISNCTSVKNQFMSSTCWSFSSTSLLESELMKMGKGKIDLSEMFIARYSMLRKIERHLKLKGGNFFTPGGQFHDVVWVIKNYGIVPEEAYTGKRYGQNDHNHAELDTVLSRFVKEQVSRGVTILSKQQRAFVDSVMDHYLGELPVTFTYKNKTYSPKSFLQQALQFNPDDYLEITSYTHHSFYSRFVLPITM